MTPVFFGSRCNCSGYDGAFVNQATCIAERRAEASDCGGEEG
jgi:hypothetical protein